jgi:hypothetical protein
MKAFQGWITSLTNNSDLNLYECRGGDISIGQAIFAAKIPSPVRVQCRREMSHTYFFQRKGLQTLRTFTAS